MFILSKHKSKERYLMLSAKSSTVLQKPSERQSSITTKKETPFQILPLTVQPLFINWFLLVKTTQTELTRTEGWAIFGSFHMTDKGLISLTGWISTCWMSYRRLNRRRCFLKVEWTRYCNLIKWGSSLRSWMMAKEIALSGHSISSVDLLR